MAALYALVSIALLFGQQRMYAFAELAERWRLLFIRLAPRRGFSFVFSEQCTACAIAITAGSGGARRASLKFICVRRGKLSGSTAKPADRR